MRITSPIHNAGIQIYSKPKPLVQPVDSVSKKKNTMTKKRKKMLLRKKFLDQKTIKYLKSKGIINTYDEVG